MDSTVIMLVKGGDRDRDGDGDGDGNGMWITSLSYERQIVERAVVD